MERPYYITETICRRKGSLALFRHGTQCRDTFPSGEGFTCSDVRVNRKAPLKLSKLSEIGRAHV